MPGVGVSLAGEMVGKRIAEGSRGSGDEEVHRKKIINERKACESVAL